MAVAGGRCPWIAGSVLVASLVVVLACCGRGCYRLEALPAINWRNFLFVIVCFQECFYLIDFMLRYVVCDMFVPLLDLLESGCVVKHLLM